MAVLLVTFATVVSPSGAAANMANPYNAGDPVGEPTGDLAQIAIVHENLAFDLRPLSDDQLAAVAATYQVRNDGGANQLNLLFVATALESQGGSDLGVSLDNVPISATTTSLQQLPTTWQPPKSTPGLNGKPDLSYNVASNSGIGFTLNLPAGPHEIHVHYRAVASALSGDEPVRYWQLGYVLAPARNWASFGTLDVSVQLPPGWQAVSSPALSRTGDTLTGTFSGVPADTLALTAQAPIPVQGTSVDPTVIAWLIGLVLAAGIGIVVGRWLARRRRSVFWSIPIAAVVAAIWMVAVIASLGVEPPDIAAVPPGQNAWTYGYGRPYIVIGVALLALPVGLVVTPAAAFLAGLAVQRTRVGGS